MGNEMIAPLDVCPSRKRRLPLETFARQSFARLDSLPMRLLRHDLLHTYQIVFNLVSGAANDTFTLANTLCSTRTPYEGHPYKLYFHNSSIDVRKYFFVNVLSGTICLRHQKTFKNVR